MTWYYLDWVSSCIVHVKYLVRDICTAERVQDSILTLIDAIRIFDGTKNFEAATLMFSWKSIDESEQTQSKLIKRLKFGPAASFVLDEPVVV